jgi:hypothetical protein
MKHRKLRIAFSAVCGIACALLLVLWLASYNRLVEVRGSFSPLLVELTSVNGSVRLLIWKESSKTVRPTGVFSSGSSDGSFYWSLRSLSPLGVSVSGSNFEAWSAHWLLALAALGLTVAPWISWSKSFSLRTLLIGMTLVAAILGALVYAIS